MTLEVGQWVVCENAGNDGESITVKVVGICKDSLNVINSYIMQTTSGEYIQIKPPNLHRCQVI